MKKFLTGIFVVFFSVPSFAAMTSISGSIVDKDGDPLTGATILSKTTNKYAIADINGAFSLQNIDSDDILEVSFVGCTSQTISASAANSKITLNCENNILDKAVTAAQWVSRACTDDELAPLYASAGKTARNSDGKGVHCVPTACVAEYKLTNGVCEQIICPGPRYVMNAAQNGCDDMVGRDCKSGDANAQSAKYEMNGSTLECVIKKCNSPKYRLDGGKCVLSDGPCSAEQIAAIPHATAGELRRGVCKATACDAEYKLTNGVCEKIICNGPRYVMNAAKNGCDDMVGRDCKSGDANAQSAKYEMNGSTLECVIKKCNSKYMLDGGKCVLSDGPCTAEQIAAIPHATAGELKRGVCYATACDGGGYEVSGGKCIEISGGCKSMPANAKVAHRVWNTETNSEQCIIDECAADYNVSDDKLSCIEKPQPTLTAEQSAAKVQELRENYNTQKAKEQSTANKLIGAAGIGATGIGAQMAASALAEQRADNVAEADMTAYLATFKCDYGMGRNINGGDKEVELPGGNDLLSLYNEYKTLADDLKIRKEALGLSAGIESQVILDKASTGLYDDESTGITNGTYASLARALANPTGADAEKWNAQKSETSQKLKAGAITAGVGAATSLVADIAVNSGAAKQNRSDEIVAKYAPLYKLQNDVEKYAPLYKLQSDVAKLPDSEASITCPSDTNGTYPNCECNNKDNMVFNTNSNMCEACPPDRVVQDGKCVVDALNAKCDISDPNIVVAADGTCSCQNGFRLSPDGQTCQCPTTGFALNGGKCVRSNPTLAQVATDIMPAQHIVLPAKNLFALGKSTLTSAAKNTITSFASQVKTSVATGDSSDYCITVVGHTDKTGNAKLNYNLSVNRANAVKEALISADLSVQNIQASGRGQTECTMNGAQESCRKVDITYRDSKC